MNMETTFTAPEEGVLNRIHLQDVSLVNTDDLIITLK
jgi:pyruvate carboxylase